MKLFPFTAIVGQEKAKLALICNAIDPSIGGVLLSGDKGTGKSTMVRAFSQVLPEIDVVEGCVFNCNPYNEAEMCEECRKKAISSSLKIAKRKMRVVDLPLSVTLDRLVGTIELSRAIKEGIRALQPGILAEANRNILYIDEVNLLEDYVADVLLDAAAMGWNVIEREGLSLKHPSRFILVGSMNPEEGELRPQLLDRFGMFVAIEAINDVEQRIEIVRRVSEFQEDPVGFYERYRSQEERLRDAIVKAREILKEVEVSDEILRLLVETIVQMGIRTHRAEIATLKAAKAICAFDGRKKVSFEDLKRAMELTLPHRMKSRPFQKPEIPQMQKRSEEKREEKRVESAEQKSSSSGKSNDLMSSGSSERMFDAEKVNMELPRAAEEVNDCGSRSSRDCKVTLIGEKRGLAVSYTLPLKECSDLNLFATLNAASLKGFPLQVCEEDFRVNVRRARAPRLTAIILDSSGSMGLQKRMSIAKGIAKKIVESSYQRRDYLSLIVFRGSEAEVVVPPTKRYEAIFDAIDAIPTGGKTPLPSALFKLSELAKSFRRKKTFVRGILITDGKANVPLFGTVEEDLRKLSQKLAKQGVKLEIHDTRPKAFDPSPSFIELISEITNAEVLRY